MTPSKHLSEILHEILTIIDERVPNLHHKLETPTMVAIVNKTS